jgi:hypothetical protein
MNDAILQRISRIYAAIDSIEEDDPHKLKATVIQTEEIKAVIQDFRGDFSDADLSNLVHSVIHNIANLRDHLRRWASHHDQNNNKVEQAIDSCPELQMIIDLSNNDKHGYPPRDGGRSGQCPQLLAINRVMRLHTRAEKGSGIGITIDSNGVPRFIGDGTARAVITGDVADNEGNRIGDLYDTVDKAVEAWETLLADFGLLATTDGA